MRRSATASAWKPRWPEVKEYVVPIGVASLPRKGDSGNRRQLRAHIDAYACRRPTNSSAERGWAFDVIDLRSIFPYDWNAIGGSVKKTGRLLIVNEDTEVTNFGEHLLRRAIDEFFYDLKVRPAQYWPASTSPALASIKSTNKTRFRSFQTSRQRWRNS